MGEYELWVNMNYGWGDRQTDRHTDRQTHTDRHTHTDRQTLQYHDLAERK